MNHYQKRLSVRLLGLAAVLATVPIQGAWAKDTSTLGNASNFAVLGSAVACTGGSITGDVGSSGDPTTVVATGCPITGAIIAPVSVNVLSDFEDAYDALAAVPCDVTVTGTLAGITLAPGVICFDAAATLTGTLTLDGPSTGVWVFKIGALTPGALTGTDFSVVMASGAEPCNVYWWVADAATMTTSDFQGTILAGADITTTGGTFVGRALTAGAVTMTDTETSISDCGGKAAKHPKEPKPPKEPKHPKHPKHPHHPHHAKS